MKKKAVPYIPAILVLIIAGIIPFVTISSLMDIALLSKFLMLTGLLIVFCLFKVIQKSEPYNFHVIDVVFLLYAIWHALSICWAHNFSEAIFSTATVLLFYFSYLAIRLTLTIFFSF